MEDQECNQGRGDLSSYSVFGWAGEPGDFEGLLDQAEEQLDGPAEVVEFGEFRGRAGQVIGDEPQAASVVDLHDDFAHRLLEGTASSKADARAQPAVVVG